MKELLEEIKNFVRNKAFIICLILTAILSFGFGITHVSIGIDDLCFDRYVKGTWILSANRWGTWALYNFLGIYKFTPFWLELITVLTYVITALVLCSIVKIITKDKLNKISYFLLACGYISFPILSYQFVYESTNISLAISNLLVIIVSYLIFNNYNSSKNKLMNVFYIIVLAFSIACYESCLQTYVVFSTMIVLIWTKYSDEQISIKQIFIVFAILFINLLISIEVYLGVAFLEKSYLNGMNKLHSNEAYHINVLGAYNINILDGIEIFKIRFIGYFIRDKILEICQNGSQNMFVLIMLLFTLLFMICNIYDAISKKRYKMILISIFAIFGNLIFPFFITRLLYRIYYSWAIMIGLEFLYVFETISRIQIMNKYKIEKIVLCIFAFCILMQTKETHNIILDDWQINEKARNKFIFIGNTIENYCDNPQKPVIYICNSITGDVMDWGCFAFYEQGTEITKYINYNGFNIKNANQEFDQKIKESEDYKNRKELNKCVSEGKKYIYVKVD